MSMVAARGHQEDKMQQEGRSNKDPRAVARELAEQALAAGNPLEWFDRLYGLAESGQASVPWADRVVNPNLIHLYERFKDRLPCSTVLVVGCGLGDDAEYFAALNFKVTAFDISVTAISQCCRRFPTTTVAYRTENLFEMPANWKNGFDVVIESYTLQVLPQTMRSGAIRNICRTLSPGGYLLFVSRAREESEPRGTMPWPLTRRELREFQRCGLREIYFEDYYDHSEDSAVRRFRCCYHKAIA
jgi:2-polyprenyl-3-methyl-5-hydroxy-6-metoxy-1,4-benzoquinol methylase